MIIEIILLVIVTFFCFFLLFIFSKHDFVLLRQNISLSEIFDSAVLSFIPAIIVGRAISILNGFRFDLFNILKFFHLIKFPGISSLGFFIGGALAIYFLYRKKKGIGRIYDIFALSFIPLYGFFLVLRSLQTHIIYIPTILIVILCFIFYFFVRSHSRYILRDGSISLLLLLIICLDNLFLGLLVGEKNLLLSLSPAQIISIPLGILSIVCFFLNQRRSR